MDWLSIANCKSYQRVVPYLGYWFNIVYHIVYDYLYTIVMIYHMTYIYIPLPSGKVTKLWKITIFDGKTHYKLPFSIAMLNYQRVFQIWISHDFTQTPIFKDLEPPWLSRPGHAGPPLALADHAPSRAARGMHGAGPWPGHRLIRQRSDELEEAGLASTNGHL